jgi:hypothetical protein
VLSSPRLVEWLGPFRGSSFIGPAACCGLLDPELLGIPPTSIPVDIAKLFSLSLRHPACREGCGVREFSRCFGCHVVCTPGLITRANCRAKRLVRVRSAACASGGSPAPPALSARPSLLFCSARRNGYSRIYPPLSGPPMSSRSGSSAARRQKGGLQPSRGSSRLRQCLPSIALTL